MPGLVLFFSHQKKESCLCEFLWFAGNNVVVLRKNVDMVKEKHGFGNYDKELDENIL
jgi:hypothetical protein